MKDNDAQNKKSVGNRKHHRLKLVGCVIISLAVDIIFYYLITAPIDCGGVLGNLETEKGVRMI